jgi:hypothetical protein
MGLATYKRTKIIEALSSSDGYVTRAARLLVCSSKTIRNAVRRYAPLKDVLAAIRLRRTGWNPAEPAAYTGSAKPRGKSREQIKLDA